MSSLFSLNKGVAVAQVVHQVIYQVSDVWTLKGSTSDATIFKEVFCHCQVLFKATGKHKRLLKACKGYIHHVQAAFYQAIRLRLHMRKMDAFQKHRIHRHSTSVRASHRSGVDL